MKPKQFAVLMGVTASLIGIDLGLAAPATGGGGSSSAAAAPATAPAASTSSSANNSADNNNSKVGTGSTTAVNPANNQNAATIIPTNATSVTTNPGSRPVNPVQNVNPNASTTVLPNTAIQPFLPGVTPIPPTAIVPTGNGAMINGTVYGTGGKVYYIATDGLLYYRGVNGAYTTFGRFLPGTTGQPPITAAQDTPPAGTTPSLVTTNSIAAASTNSASAQVEPGIYAPGSTVPSPPVAAPGAYSLNAGGQVTITGTAVGTDGKTFYLGSDGFLYFRGTDGALHIFGSGLPK